MKTIAIKIPQVRAVLLCLLLSCIEGQASNYYWVGGSGQWSDQTHNHWANSSGGGTFYNFPPDSADDVYFDANSFSAPGARVTVDGNSASCRNFDWSQVTNHPVFDLDTLGPPGCDMNIYGSFILSPDMDWRYGSNSNMCHIRIGSVSSGHFIDFAGHSAYGRTDIHIGDRFSQTGLYVLLSDISTYRFEVNFGTLNTNNKNIHAEDEITLSNGVTDLTNSVITTQFFNARQSAVVDPGTAFIYCDEFDVQSSVAPYHFVQSRQAHLRNSSINTLHIADELDGINANINTAFIGADTINNCDVRVSAFHFGKGICRANNVHFSSNSPSTTFTFDTLFLATIGGHYNFSDSDTIVINNSLIVNSGPGNLTTLGTLPGFHSAQMICYTDTVCLDYLIVSNLAAVGPAVFYAGANSTNAGSNPGWNFTACSIHSNVWPGDADYDLQCNNLDVLNIGLAYGSSGPVRNGASGNWSPQAAPDWSNYFNSGVNYKHADTDGNGVVDIADTTYISQNYGRTHPARLRQIPGLSTLTSPSITLTPSTHFVRPGEHVTVDISAGTSFMPVDSIYGIAFTINLDPSLVYLDSIVTDFTTSWIGNISADLIAFTKIDSFGRLDITLVRNDHTNIFNGSGTIGMFDIVIVDNVSTVQSQLLRVSGVRAITVSQTPLSLNPGTDSVLVDPLLGIHSILADDQLMVYPNPATEQLHISPNTNIQRVTLINSLGSVVKDLPGSFFRTPVNISGLAPDVYVINIYTGKNIIRRKVVVREP